MNSATRQFRFNLCEEVGRCEVCGKRFAVNRLCCHEILYGPFRAACLGQRCAILVVCHPGCHGIAQHEPKRRQLARLYLSRPGDLDFPQFCELWCRAPTAITVDEVMAEVDSILGNYRDSYNNG
jgi:hypothetical protein